MSSRTPAFCLWDTQVGVILASVGKVVVVDRLVVGIIDMSSVKIPLGRYPLIV